MREMVDAGDKSVNEEQTNEPSKQQPKKPRTFWDLVIENPEAAASFITAMLSNLKPYADKLIQYQQDKQKHEITMERAVSKFASVILTISLVGTFAFGLLIGILVYFHTVSGDALLFYVGVVMGFLLSLIRKQMPGFGDKGDETAP